MSRVTVVGAGPSGLMAAWKAAAAGHQVTVLDRAERPGGMAASFEVGGQRVDFGSHRLHPSTPPDVLDQLRALLGDDLQVRPRHGRIRMEGRWIGFPLRTTDLVTKLPRRFAAHAALDAATSPFRRPKQDTFAEVVRAGLGPTVADAFYRPYIEKIWGVTPDQLTGELARRRVSASSPLTIARKLVRGAKPEGRTFLYPRGGFGRISEALAQAATEAGAELRLGRPVSGVSWSDDEVTVALGPAGADADEVTGDHLWWTAPLAALARLATPAPPDAVLESCRQLRHRALALVYLVIDRPRYTEFDAHYFPAAGNPIARLSEPKNYRDDDRDPAGTTVLCAEVPCSPHDRTWASSDEDLGRLVADALVADGLPRPEPVAVEVRRLPSVYPVYRPEAAWDLAALELWVADRPRLAIFGRQGLFVPDNTHHALVMGLEAAACLSADGRFDQTRWEAARAAFRDHVVED